MARLRVDRYVSEDERENEDGSGSGSEEKFPDLGEFLRSRPKIKGVGGLKGGERGEEKGEEGNGGGEEGGGIRNKKKKRVLGKRDDNPLLRPLGAISKGVKGKGKVGKNAAELGVVIGFGDGVGEVGGKRRGRKVVVVKAEEVEGSIGVESSGGLTGKSMELKFGAREKGKKGKARGGWVEKPILEGDQDSGMGEGFGGTLVQDSVPEGRTPEIERVVLRITQESKNQGSDLPIDSTTDISTSSLPEEPGKSKRRTRKAPKVTAPKTVTHLEWEDEEEDLRLDLEDDDDDLSDFIVDDSEVLDEEDSVVEIPDLPPPRSVRRLVRGRKPREDDELELDMGRLNLSDPFEDTAVKQTKNFDDDSESRRKKTTKPAKENKAKISLPEPSSDLDDPFTLRYSPSTAKPIRNITPPSSPLKYKPGGLPSPKKLPRIPDTPHRPSTDAFWSQDVINTWNDEFSPLKTLKTPKPAPKSKSLFKNSTHLPLSTTQSPQKTEKEKKEAKKAFAAIRETLATSFLHELDEKITNGQIATLSAQTGGVKIIWSKKLSTTAGRANWKRETIRSTSLNPSTGEKESSLSYRHHASIELAEKVIDCEERLVNVVAHEFCHLANFMVSGVKGNPHGKEFREWGRKVGSVFGGRGVVVTTKHGYEIEWKYWWECEVCGMGFGRHSRSIDVGRHRCGVCKGVLVQIRPVARKGGEGKGEEKGMGEYQRFMKENLGRVRGEERFRGSPQKEIMGEVGRRFREFKAAKAVDGVSVDVKEVGSKEGTPIPIDGDAVGDVVRKLDFLDLTSP